MAFNVQSTDRRNEDIHFWEIQKEACEKFAAALEKAGAKRRIGKPCEHDRPRLISARWLGSSGCSSSAGWLQK
jgi:hypothetical protein